MKLVIIESPYGQDPAFFRAYALRCLRDSLYRGEAPIASHLLYPLVLDDGNIEERWIGINAGHRWLRHADLVAVYQDYGISSGMSRGIAAATSVGIPLTYRSIGFAPH